MIKRISVYTTGIAIKDGPVNHYRPGEGYTLLKANHPDKEYVFAIDAANLIPKESFSFIFASKVFIKTLTRDEDGTFYDLGESILTDRLIVGKVRQFLSGPVIDLNKDANIMGFVLMDLEF